MLMRASAHTNRGSIHAAGTSTMPPTTTATGSVTSRTRPLLAERSHLTRCTKLLCSAFLTVLLLAGVILFVAYLAVRPHRPRFHVTAFSAAGIPSGGPVVLSGQLSVHNPNHDVAFFFDRLYMSVQYRGGEVVSDQDLTGGPLYQPPKSTSPVAFQGVEVAPATVGGQMARDAADGGTVAVTVKVRSRIRARLAFWGNRHWHPLHVSCDVAVGPDGQLLPEYQQKRCSIDFF
ncbi:NDR1/HIN1-like protein 26 [Phragmites australis]|uniref:NDR1/HIN1-like protein 26 n=1 Tax=Phragmites australis TaxID=29695 RepID=UPI002D77AEC2|nr:NDR1/HIN1-like protein 26 [Phragmites australis]